MNKLIIAITTLILMLAGAGATEAQTPAASSSAPPLCVRLRLGIMWPQDATVRHWAGDTPVDAGLDMEANQKASSGRPISGAYLDYAGGSKGPHVSVVGLGGSARFYASGPDGAGDPNDVVVGPPLFVGMGAGAYEVMSSRGNGLAPGLKPFVGLGGNTGLLAELGYNLIATTRGIDASGLFFQVGMTMK